MSPNESTRSISNHDSDEASLRASSPGHSGGGGGGGREGRRVCNYISGM